MKKKKYNVIKEVKRSARDVIGSPSKGKKVGAHKDLYKEANKNECRKPVDTTECAVTDDTEWTEDGWEPVNHWHKWSGWPGAWCLDCGVEDQLEICLGDSCPHSPYPVPPGEPEIPPCPVHKNGPCLQKGKDLFNPYVKK